MAYNMDMYDYLNMLNQPSNVFTVNAPAEKTGEKFLTREQARAKEIKEKEELRLWWDDLPEDKRQDVRDQQFVEKKKKKPVDLNSNRDRCQSMLSLIMALILERPNQTRREFW